MPQDLQGFAPGDTQTTPVTSTGGGGDWIGALIGAGTAVYTTIEQKNAQERQNKANMALAQYQYDRQMEAWNMQNQYNSPLNQIARLRAAGLAPELMYGNGGASAGNASEYPKYNAPNMVQEFAPITQALPQMLSLYQSFQMKQAQINNVKADTRAKEVRAAADALRPAFLSKSTERMSQEMDRIRLDMRMKEGLMPYNLSIKQQEADQAVHKTAQEYRRIGLMDQQSTKNALDFGIKGELKQNLQVQREKQLEEIQFLRFKNSLGERGLTTGDNVALRMLFKQMQELDLIDPLMQGVKNWLTPSNTSQENDRVWKKYRKEEAWKHGAQSTW